MKGLNIKKVAAIGIGAALIGSALAPVVSANQVPGGLSGLERSDIVDATGSPVVDIVVGSNAAVSDVVWAGNIAARVAQLATTSVAGGAGDVTDATVDVTVGGQTQVSGAGELAEDDFDWGFQEPNLENIEVSSSQVPYLVNDTSAKFRWLGDDITTSIQETFEATINPVYQGQTGSTRVAPGELVATVAQNDFNYRIAFGTGLDLTPRANLDANSMFDVRVPLLGKIYVLDEIKDNGETVVLYSQTLPQRLNPGAILTVPGAGNYAGKDLSLELVTVWIDSSDDTYNAEWTLRDGDTLINTREVKGRNYDIRDEFGSNIVDKSVYVTNVAQDLVASQFYASVRTGEDRIELRDGEGYPYTRDAAVDQDAQWRVFFETDSSGLLTDVVFRNNWSYTSTSGSETNTSKHVLRVGEEISLPDEYGVLRLVGWEDKLMYEAHIGENKVVFTDTRNKVQNIDFMAQISLEEQRARRHVINGEEYTFWLTPGSTELLYRKGDHSSITSTPSTGWTSVPVSSGDVNGSVIIDSGTSASNPFNVDYNALVDSSNNRLYLLLAAQNLGFMNTRANTDAYISFQGTALNANAFPAGTFELTAVSALTAPDANAVPFYLPNIDTISDALGVDFNSDPDKYMAAQFTYTNLADTNTRLFVRADQDGQVWNYDSIREEANVFGPARDGHYPEWTRAIRGGDDWLTAAFTTDGSEISSEGSKFRIVYPEEQRQVQAFLGSSDLVETPVGGGSQTIAEGDMATISGVSVRIDSVAAACEAEGGVALVPTGNLVRTDAQSGKARQIIVGGYVVNAMARDLEVMNGNTLEDLLLNSGDYVAALLNSGKIVVAGYTADDTARAARDLISALDALI